MCKELSVVEAFSDCCLGLTAGGTSSSAREDNRGAEVVVDVCEGGRVAVPRWPRRTGTGGGGEGAELVGEPAERAEVVGGDWWVWLVGSEFSGVRGIPLG